jgi:hypothetical protein
LRDHGWVEAVKAYLPLIRGIPDLARDSRG